jgi:hypothetical protein
MGHSVDCKMKFSHLCGSIIIDSKGIKEQKKKYLNCKKIHPNKFRELYHNILLGIKLTKVP